MIADLADPHQELASTRPQNVTVLVVDDHRSFADLLSWALKSVPGMACIGTAGSAEEGVSLADALQPDIVVMDIEMPRVDGIAATRRVRLVAPNAVIAVVTAHCTGEWLLKAAQAGASAFIAKDGSMKDMIDMLRQARRGHMLVADSAFDGPAPTPAKAIDPRAPAITPREQEVLQFMGQGLHAADIASVLGISVHTCRGYVKALLKKLGANTQLEAVIKAQHLGIIVHL
ncbi:response regulator transcription factor [Nakamurella sp. PAMC28650]|uniref:response regulator n=1 Tax=Nakamurella sp. PAMC28650 TaxID=2762325 RepID=UPI00164DE8D4|nr:response regulator transcription factor [Nakamurella sp. PAMC28650]QNK79692.1 response regulator transcription factor [Nakamurella sp. PAMC28650]